jgi:hypothetical protein
MIEQHVQGVSAALARFKIAEGMPPGILDRLKSFGSGQLGAAKSLAGNLHAGVLGGTPQHALPEGMPGPEFGAAGHRAQALGNLKTLAPSLAVGGGAYMLHRHNQNQEQDERARQNAMMMQQGYGQSM